MKVIECKILPATNTKPKRIKASYEGRSIVLSTNALEGDICILAAKVLKEKLDITGEFVGGHVNGGMVFVQLHPTKYKV